MIHCTINGISSKEYGVYLDESALATLMTPAPHKADITNSSRIEHGVRVLDKPELVRVDERSISIKIAIVAQSRAEFFSLYYKFCNEVLSTGKVHITTPYQPNVVYKCRYKSCEPLTYADGRIAKFTLSLREPNPADRSINEPEE